MTNITFETQSEGWDWRSLIRTYRFWGLVLVSFLMVFAETANSGLMFSWTEHGVSYETFTRFTYLSMLVAGLLSVYFFRTRLKHSLVMLTLVYLLSLFLLRFGPITQSEIYIAATFFKNIGYFGIILTILAALVTAKLPLRSFLIALLIIWLCKSVGQVLAGIYSFAYIDLEYQNFSFHYNENEGDIKASVQEVFFYNLLCLLPAALAVFAAALLKSRMFFEPHVVRAKTSPHLPLKDQPSGWLWQDLISSYRFWGLVLVSFFVGFVQNANLFLGTTFPQDFVDEFGRGMYTCIKYAPPLIAGLLTLYFLKYRIKAPLIGFSLLFLIALSLARFGFIKNSVSFVVMDVFRGVGYYGVILTILSALVSAKLPLKSFLIAFFIIWFWSYVGDILGFAYDNIELSYSPIDDKKTPPASFVFFQFVVPVLPAAFAILAAIKLKPKMFLEPPNIEVGAKDTTARTPFGVFAAALVVPFYFLYWLFKQPGELKTLAPDMHLPSPLGMLCLGLFAPLILPIWFHGVRKGLGSKLKVRSARRIAVASFFMPALAVGMAQSDYNKIVNDKSDST